ncbi:arsenate reductase [Colwellia chukchiensis]|uniref:Arsenate reductase n=1 Tax=Colwellia chukchiensis TaxID=641665 RepID=A0A1H7M0S6_9GAMM|nr:arsenate reductase (glutaredoxin) [Colwellia chukchiensis]SEL04598.1 arsenate reductase [Colwellia chukchiensis]
MLTIYHNPRCSKSRQTLALLEEHNQDVTVVEYLKTPLNAAQITELASLLKLSPVEMMRTKESEFKEQNLAAADDETLIAAMVATPKLMERPIVTDSTRAVIGRPPENVLTLISGAK